ncbi:hypothetical protein BJ138DRAFT_1155473 [Hygrophoropsis aurantiaca]|uniref:Uncharacterized protein n=1 Tax=Hygrophoropsis aurantiaca TaxID=72124 RepID=A0ACB8A9J7_9AGAM|nr:hypothetical protein BJ138DRAFT_1155473 [Hygrophoropsis aurantiaca]
MTLAFSESSPGDAKEQPGRTTEVPFVRKDDRFYFTNVVFLVESTLFRVPKHVFVNESDVFRQMFELPVPDGVEVDGCSDERPLRLDLIKQDDFKQLLKALLPDPRNPQNNPKSPSDWISVLKLSTMWDFARIKTQAIGSLKSLTMDPIDKICLARDYHVTEWIVPTMNDLAKRKEPIGMKDVEKIGIELGLRIAAIREGIVYTAGNSNYNGNHQSPAVGARDASNIDFTRAIEALLSWDPDVLSRSKP